MIDLLDVGRLSRAIEAVGETIPEHEEGGGYVRLPTGEEVAAAYMAVAPTVWIEAMGPLPPLEHGMRRTIITEGRRRFWRDDPEPPARYDIE